MLEYSESYAETTATNEFYYLDTSREAEERTAQAAYNKGFHKRKTVLGASSVVNFELPLNRYSLFETLEDKLLRVMTICEPASQRAMRAMRAMQISHLSLSTHFK